MNAIITIDRNQIADFYFDYKNNHCAYAFCLRIDNKALITSRYGELTYELVEQIIEKHIKSQFESPQESLLVFNHSIKKEDIYFIQSQQKITPDKINIILHSIKEECALALSIHENLIGLTFTIIHSNHHINHQFAIDHIDSFKSDMKTNSVSLFKASENDNFYLDEFIDAYTKNNVTLFGQPIYNSNDLELFSVELLIRYKGNLEGWRNPENLIRDATNHAFLEELTMIVLNLSVSWMQKLKRNNINVPVSINLSAKQMAITGCFDKIKSTLETNNLLPSDLTIELTEEYPIKTGSPAAIFLDQCAEFGITLSLDDIGIGPEYNNVEDLYSGRFQIAKLDKTFANKENSEPNNLSAIKTITPIIKSVGCIIVIEGVEDKNHHLPIGDDYKYQGFAYSKPLPINDFLIMEGCL